MVAKKHKLCISITIPSFGKMHVPVPTIVPPFILPFVAFTLFAFFGSFQRIKLHMMSRKNIKLIILRLKISILLVPKKLRSDFFLMIEKHTYRKLFFQCS